MYFAKKVNTRSRKAMIDFLTNHFRYNTMNSWNNSSSYAHCVKVHKLGLTRDQLNTAYDLLGVSYTYDWLNDIISEFDTYHDHKWQMGFNGRSSGYIVLYKGALDYENAKTAYCDECGQTTWHTVSIPCTRTGCTGTLRLFAKPSPQIISYPGKSVDADKNFDEWSVDDLQYRVKLVSRFDQAVDEMRLRFIDLCNEYTVEDKIVYKPVKEKQLVLRKDANE